MIAGIILAGGAGRRMGGLDKAALRVGGVTLLDRVLGAARPVCDRLVVVGPARPTAVTGVAFVAEAEPGGGPAPAVLAGIGAAPGCQVALVLSVDLPLLATADLRRLLDALGAGADAAAAGGADGAGGGPNPLLAAYRVPALAARWAATDLGAGSPARRLLPPAPVLVDLGPAMLNVNLAADLAVAEAIIEARAPASDYTPPPGRSTRGGEAVNANFPDRYAGALGLGLSEQEADAMLHLARAVAHGSERRFAPLSTFLAGQYVAERVHTGVTRADALTEAIALAEHTLAAEE